MQIRTIFLFLVLVTGCSTPLATDSSESKHLTTEEVKQICETQHRELSTEITGLLLARDNGIEYLNGRLDEDLAKVNHRISLMDQDLLRNSSSINAELKRLQVRLNLLEEKMELLTGPPVLKLEDEEN